MPRDLSITPVKTFVEETLLGGRPVEMDENLLLSGLVDSLGVMSLVTFIEEEYGFQIPFDDVVIENFMSLEAIEAYVARRCAPDA